MFKHLELSRSRKPNTRRNYVAVANATNQKPKKEELVFVKGGFDAFASTAVNQSLRASKKSAFGNHNKSSVAHITQSSQSAYNALRVSDGSSATPDPDYNRSKTTQQRLTQDGQVADSSMQTSTAEYHRMNTDKDENN